MPDGAVLLWRQYRFERRMFWRNPSAAFFNFLTAVDLPGVVRRDRPRPPERARRHRPRDRWDERHGDDVHGARLQPDLPA